MEKGEDPKEHAGEHIDHIKYVIAKNLTEFLQYIIDNKMELPYK